MIPLYVGWKSFPERKGLVSSLIMFANGMGPIFANTFTTFIVNPNNLSPTIEVDIGSTTYIFYDEEVAFSVPQMFRYLVLCEAIIIFLAIPFIYVPPEEDENDQRDEEENEENRESQKLVLNESAMNLSVNY